MNRFYTASLKYSVRWGEPLTTSHIPHSHECGPFLPPVAQAEPSGSRRNPSAGFGYLHPPRACAHTVRQKHGDFFAPTVHGESNHALSGRCYGRLGEDEEIRAHLGNQPLPPTHL
jgi:hypothetical protein